MLQYIPKLKIAFSFLLLMLIATTGYTQVVPRPQPVWWFGESIAANFNTYRGTTQAINEGMQAPTAFHNGNGVKPYASLLIEYRPNKRWGGALNIAYDNRGGKFNEVIAPCNCPENLSTNISYLAIEPSLRYAPFASAFYLFAGPTLNVNLTKRFKYTQENQSDVIGDWSDINHVLVSAQIGAGIDIPISARRNPTQITLSPFASFQTDLGNLPRTVESWSFYTIRTGIAFKIGTSRRSVPASAVVIAPPIAPPVIASEKEIQFSVRAPKVVPLERRVKEIFPLRNSVFFNVGSTDIPNRYVLLNRSQALSFKEEQLQEDQPDNLNSNRPARQLALYYNILNIMGDRMRDNTGSSIVLIGSSEKNPSEGKMMAENIKEYLVSVFGINASRIRTEGRDKPVIPSEQSGATQELALLREGDRRVDIESHSPELLMEVGGSASPFLKPVQIIVHQQDPLDSHVIFNVAGATETLNSWTIQITDEQGNVQHYGPYTSDQASVAGKIILGNNTQGNYTIVLTGQTKSGHTIEKESSVSLIKINDAKQDGLRYSILFDFDRSKSIAVYENFLINIVTPLIPDNGTVIIHGHTDIIGEDGYNLKLSQNRAAGAQQVIEHALANTGKKGVRFETYGFGEDESKAPFGNDMPEKRCYNRTVIIDIIPAN